MQFSALNSDSSPNPLSPHGTSHPGIAEICTKEALESEAFKLYYRGLSLQQDGQLGGAMEALLSVLDSPYLTHHLQDAGKKVSSELLKGKACKLKFFALRNLACICEQKQAWQECISRCEEALQIDDTDGMLWYRLGRVSLRLFELELCAFALSEALTRSPHLTPARKSLIPVLYAIYRYDECLAHCSLLLSRTPHSQLAADYASWILKSQPFTDPPDSKPIKAIFSRLHSLDLSSLEESPHLREGGRLRAEHRLAFPAAPELEQWQPETAIAAHSWLELGLFLLGLLREADGAGKSLHPCLLLRGDAESPELEDQTDARGEEGEKKPHRRRGTECFDFIPAAKRRSLRSSQQPPPEEGSRRLSKDINDLVAEFIASRWPYFSQPHWMTSHPSSPHKSPLTPPDPRLLLRLQPPLEREKEKVSLFLRSHNLSPVCSLLPRFLEASAQLSLLAWPEAGKLQSVVSQVYLACHGRFLSLPDQLSACKLDTAYVVLMFVEIAAQQNCSHPDAALCQEVLEAAHFLERVCFSPTVPCKQWYGFFLRSCWSLALLSQHRSLLDKQLALLRYALQLFDLYTEMPESDAILASSQDSNLSDSSNLDGFSLEYPPDELTVLHPNLHTVISRGLVQERIQKVMTSHSIDREILFDYFLRGENKSLIGSIRPFVSNSSNAPFSFLLAPLQTPTDSGLAVNLVLLSLECIRSSEDGAGLPLCLDILSSLVVSISDRIDSTQDASTGLEAELSTLTDVTELFVFREKRGELKFDSSSQFEGFVWCLLRILQFYWEVQSSSVKRLLPLSPVICLLFHSIKLHDRLSRPDSHDDVTSDSTPKTELQMGTETPSLPLSPSARAPDPTEKRSLLAQSKLNSLNPGLCFLFECHELFGSARHCCLQQGQLLHLLLQETSRALLGLGRDEGCTCVREMLQAELTQILFCLFGYPAKRFRSLGLSEHRESEECLPVFHWPSCYLMLTHLCPSSLPPFDDNKSIGVSPDLIILCKRIAEHLPYQQHTGISPQQLDAFIESESDSFPAEFTVSPSSHEALCISRVYYVIADDFLKSHSSRAIEFYSRHLLFHPTHPDSWAGLTLANFRKFQYSLDERKQYSSASYVREIRDAIVRVSKCFKQANRLYPSHSQLLERFGHFCYQINSFWRHLSNSLILPETGRVYGELPHPPNTDLELEQSLSVFQKALDFESHFAEPWLHHYLLAKIKMKLGRSLEECFSHLATSARTLHADRAAYPEHVDCNSANYACEAIEVHYLIHSYFIKYLLGDRPGALECVERGLLALKEVSPLSSSPPHDTSIELFMQTHKSQILEALGHSPPPTRGERFMGALVGSIRGLLVCLARFPTHYKPQYRLAKTLWDISPEIFCDIVKSLLIGPIPFNDFKNEKLLPLFNLRSNLFSNMWALKSYDINRPGSFVYHMYRHVTLLYSVLAHRHSVEALISLLSLLKVKPEFAKTYLREYERVQLYHTGLLITFRVLEAVSSPDPIATSVKPLNLLKVGYILRNFSLKSSLPVQVREEMEGKLGPILLSLYKTYKGSPAEEYSLDKVLSFCAQHTNVSTPGEQGQHLKKSTKPKSGQTQPLKPKLPIVPPPTSS